MKLENNKLYKNNNSNNSNKKKKINILMTLLNN